jgi:hypothetical protein
MPEQGSIEELAVALVKACEAEGDGTIQYIRVMPNGTIEVNVQVWRLDEQHPKVYFTPRGD